MYCKDRWGFTDRHARDLIGLMQSKIEELQNDIEKLKYRLETDLEVDE